MRGLAIGRQQSVACGGAFWKQYIVRLEQELISGYNARAEEKGIELIIEMNMHMHIKIEDPSTSSGNLSSCWTLQLEK